MSNKADVSNSEVGDILKFANERIEWDTMKQNRKIVFASNARHEIANHRARLVADLFNTGTDIISK